jgi:quinol-cytochrome oxidoreductase complex cytochrome b subunit
MNYVANAELAFNSVEIIMRDINFGWLLRYIHSNGASFFFICVYIHMFRGMYYFSFIKPRQNVWNIGVIILLFMIITAFTGYVSPWGQMSFWAATVITNLASAVPIFGDFIVIWLWGGFSINTFTLNRFFSIHYILPFVILFLVALHIIFLHDKGSSNRLRVVYKSDKIMFHPYFTIKDIYFIILVIFVFCIFLFYAPNYLSHPDNYIPADPLVTPAHIVPEWYFLPFYAMSRSVPSKLGGVIVLLLSIAVLLIFPIFFNYVSDFIKHNFDIRKIQEIDMSVSSTITRTNKFLIETNLFVSYIFYYYYIRVSTLFYNFYNRLKLNISKNAYATLLLYYVELYFHYFRNSFSIYPYMFSTFIVTWFILTIIGARPIDFPYLGIGRSYTFFYFLYFFIIVIYYNYINIKFSLYTFYCNMLYILIEGLNKIK